MKTKSPPPEPDAVTERRVKEHAAKDAGGRGEELLLKEIHNLRAAIDEHAAVAVTDLLGKITFVNDKFCAISKYSRGELIGQDHCIINSGFHPKKFMCELWQTIEQGKVWKGEIKNRAKDGSFFWVDMTIVPFLDQTGKPRQHVAIQADITPLKTREREIIRLNRLHTALSQINQIIARRPTRDTLFDKVCQALIQHGGFEMAWIGWHDAKARLLEPVASSGDDSGYLSEIRIYTDDRPESRGPAGTAFRENRPYICNDTFTDPVILLWREQLERHDLHGCSAFPIHIKHEVCGVLVVYAAEPDFFQDKEIALLVEAASDVSFALDNIAREEAREQGAAATALLAAIVASSDDAIIGKNLDGIVTSWNAGAEKMFGYTAGEMVGQSILRLIPLERQHEEAEILNKERSGESIQRFDTVRQRKDGSTLEVSVTISPIKDATGKIIGASKMAHDISELNLAGKNLKAAKERMQLATETTAVGIWEWNLATNEVRWDTQMFRIYGMPPTPDGFIKYDDWRNAVLPEDLTRQEEILQQTVRERGRSSREFRIRRISDGECRNLQAVELVSVNTAGHGEWVVGTNLDITERKQAEVALRESEEYFRFLKDLVEATRTLAEPVQVMAVMIRMLCTHLHASRCAYADVDSDGEQFTILDDYTDGCASTVGCYQLSLFGARAVHTLHNGQALIIRNVSAEPLTTEGADMFNAIGIQAIITCPLVKGGKLRAMMAVHQSTPRDWQPGEIALVQDVVERCWATIERRAAEERINELNTSLEQRVAERTAELEIANKELEAFSYSVSHDLRAPLRAVDGFSQAVLADFGPQLPAEGQRQLQTIRNSAQRMGTLIDDLLKFSQLSRLAMSKQPIETGDLVRATLTELSPQCEGRQIEIKLGELPLGEGDPALLKQVWVNLLSNALKYSGKREHAIVEIGSVAEKGEQVFFVRDNGAGFDIRYAHKLFGVFQRLHRAKDFEGTGVGLAIVQRIVQRHGGRIWAEAAVERGATFYFTLKGITPL